MVTQENSKSKLNWIGVTALVGGITTPIWVAFINALLEQNGVFDDPNSLLLSVLETALSFISSQIFIYVAVFLSGALAVYIGLRLSRPQDSPDFESSELQVKRSQLVAILTSIGRILSDSEPPSIQNDDETVIQSLFRKERPRLDSLNVTLKKCGFDPIDFQNFNVHERELLKYVHGEISALINDGHIEEAYERSEYLFGTATIALDQADSARPVRWIIDEDGGLYCTNHDYLIQQSRLKETRRTGEDQVYDWPVHLAEKTWFELGPFLDVFKPMLESSEGGIDEQMYERTRQEAVQIFRRRRQ